MWKRINQVLWYACLGFPTGAPTVAPLLPWFGGLNEHNTQAALTKAFYVIHVKIHWAEVLFDVAAQHYTASNAGITSALPTRGGE